MNQIFLVGLGGFIGAISRFKLGGIVLHYTPDWKFPLSTFLVNVSGCLVAGILNGLIAKHELFSPDLRLFLLTGLLGGFTTFSAFGVETITLLQRGEVAVAALNVFSSVFVGLGILWLSIKVVI